MDKTNTVPSIFPGNCRTILAKVRGGAGGEGGNELVIVDTEDGNCSLLRKLLEARGKTGS